MSDKSNAIAALEAARKQTLETISGIPDEKMAVAAFGSWSVKDVLCHFASWEQFATADLGRVRKGHIPQLATFHLDDVDDWNAWLMRSRNLFPLSQVKAELEESRAQFRAALDDLPDNLFAPGQVVRRLLDALTMGELHHAEEIRGWRQQQGV